MQENQQNFWLIQPYELIKSMNVLKVSEVSDIWQHLFHTEGGYENNFQLL